MVRRNPIFAKMVFGAAIAYAAFFILNFLPAGIPAGLMVPIAGAIAILIVEFVAEKTGFFVI